VNSALQPFFEDNIDAAIINVVYDPLDCKLLVVPGNYVMEYSGPQISDHAIS
jgi:hypothetical protein